MKTKTFTLRLISLALLGVTASAASAQVPDNDGYLFDTRGVPARSGHGLCWRTNYWTPAKAIAECDPDLVKKADAPMAMPTPAQTPEPAPVPAPPKKCDFAQSLSADATFAFGKARLSEGAKQQLDEILAKAGRCATISAVTVVGHTDRIGSERGNQALSERRAEAVKAYLESKGLRADSITAMGVANTQSMVNVRCSNKLPRRKLVECLAPDRRVVVDVQGVAQ
jgi:OOP family OmpA-OmpF porin